MEYTYFELLKTLGFAILLLYLVYFQRMKGSFNKTGYRLIMAGVGLLLINQLLVLTLAPNPTVGSSMGVEFSVLELAGLGAVIWGSARWLKALSFISDGESEMLHRRALIDLAYSREGPMDELECRFNINGELTHVNDSMCIYLGLTREELIGSNVSRFFMLENRDYILEQIRGIKKRGTKVVMEKRLMLPNGRVRWSQWELTVPADFDAGGEIIAVGRDTTELKQLQSKLMYLGLHDALTGVGNRNYFEQEMKKLDLEDKPLGLIIGDIDGLKLANDTLGQEFGNSLLVKTALLIKSCIKDRGMVARIGGDEFAILLPNVTREVLELAAIEVRASVNRVNESRANKNQVEFPLSISIGFAFREDGLTSVYDLWKEAENKMYKEQLMNMRTRRSMIVQILAKAMEARDFATEGHAERLQELAVAMGKELNLPDESITDLRLLAQFHDIGKVGIPDSILFKPGPLSAEEMAKMRTHCEIGYRIALSSRELEPIAEQILHHHEWWNGQGYPKGLKGDNIPLECQILAIVDAYDAMTNDRPYRKAMSHQAAVTELRNGAGTQFSPVLVEKFLKMIGDKGAGAHEGRFRLME